MCFGSGAMLVAHATGWLGLCAVLLGCAEIPKLASFQWKHSGWMQLQVKQWGVGRLLVGQVVIVCSSVVVCLCTMQAQCAALGSVSEGVLLSMLQQANMK